MNSLFLVSGEISGDTHGSALLRALAVSGEWQFAGLGGPRMQEVSGEIENWLDEAAVLGLWEVLKKYGYFKNKLNETVSGILRRKPDGVVLIDYPGFNLRLAKRLRKEGYRGKLIYYISPQVWAWKKGRIKSMSELLDLMICIFPFEKKLYEGSGLVTQFSGHPLVDEMGKLKNDSLVRDSKLVALLPGSREREIEKLFPPMLGAAASLLKQFSDLRFATSGATPGLAKRLKGMVSEAGLSGSVEVGESNSHDIMQTAGVGVVASGTATLEAACLGLPYCLTYKVAWLTAVAARRLMQVNYLGIVNIMADREVVTELLQDRASAEGIAEALADLLSSKDKRSQLQSDLAEVVTTLGGGGAHENAARIISHLWEN